MFSGILFLAGVVIVFGTPFGQHEVQRSQGVTNNPNTFRLCDPEQIRITIHLACKQSIYSPNSRYQRGLTTTGNEIFIEGQMPRRIHRSFLDDCCRNPCSMQNLQRYCAKDTTSTTEEPRYVSLQTLFSRLSEFFRQVDSSARVSTFTVKPWEVSKHVEIIPNMSVQQTSQSAERRVSSNLMPFEETSEGLDEAGNSEFIKQGAIRLIQAHLIRRDNSEENALGRIPGIEVIRSPSYPEPTPILNK